MRTRRLRWFGAMAVAAALVGSAAGSHVSAAPGPSSAREAASLTAIKRHTYRMAGRVRPLLFWIGRDNVGSARIVWREDAGKGRGYELLVGTDPARTPRGINRWGFIAEQVEGRDGRLLAVMSKSDEASLGEAQASADGASAGREYKAMRASLDRGTLSWQVASIRTPTALTISELEPLLDRARVETSAAQARSRPVPGDARPGFLVAVAELVDRAVAARRAHAPLDALRGATVPYVFGQQSYELRFTRIAPATLARPGGDVQGCASAFEIRNLSTGQRTAFEMSFASDGELAGVPVAIAWQPRWWLKVELALE